MGEPPSISSLKGVEVSAGVRSHSDEKLDYYTNQLVENFQQAARRIRWVSVEVEVTQLYPGYHYTESDLVVKQAVAAINEDWASTCLSFKWWRKRCKCSFQLWDSDGAI